MSVEWMNNNVSFLDLAKLHRGEPTFQSMHGAKVIEILNLLEIVEDLGDRVMELGRSGKMPVDSATRLLARLLECYSAPLANSKELSQIRIELGKANR